MKLDAKMLALPEIVQAMIACRENARELIADSDILLGAGRYARAFALLHTACEELGKFSLLEIAARRIIQGTLPEWKRFWRRFRSHDSKSAQLEVQLLLSSISSNDETLSELAEPFLGRGLIVRNAALYVDQGPDGSFRKPSDIDFKEPLPIFRAVASRLLYRADQNGKTALEIESELRSPTEDKSRKNMQALLLRVFERARDLGIEKEKLNDIIAKSFRR